MFLPNSFNWVLFIRMMYPLPKALFYPEQSLRIKCISLNITFALMGKSSCKCYIYIKGN